MSVSCLDSGVAARFPVGAPSQCGVAVSFAGGSGDWGRSLASLGQGRVPEIQKRALCTPEELYPSAQSLALGGPWPDPPPHPGAPGTASPPPPQTRAGPVSTSGNCLVLAGVASGKGELGGMGTGGETSFSPSTPLFSLNFIPCAYCLFQKYSLIFK